MVKKEPLQFDVYFVALDPTVGSEIKKTRPYVIVSPDQMNKYIKTVIIAPLTSTIRNYPTRVFVTLEKKEGQIVLDQIRTIDKKRLIQFLGRISALEAKQMLSVLREMFSEG